MGDRLTVELVRAARNMMGNVSCNALGAGGAVWPVSVADLCDTCESLRAEVERLAEQRNSASANAGNLSVLLSEARAEVARLRPDRDEVKRMYCREIAKHGERIYGEGDGCRWNTPRKVCALYWPDDVDALFPPEVKP